MKLFRDYSVLAGGQIAGRLIGFLAFAWLARALDPEGYGAVEYLVGLAAFFATLIDGGLGVVGVRHAIHDATALPRLALQISIARWALAAVAVPAMALIASNALGGARHAVLAWLFAASLVTLPWRQEWLLQATGRMSELAIVQMLRMAVFAVWVWILVTQPGDASATGWAELGAGAAATAYCIHVQRSRVTPFRLTGSMRGFVPLAREALAVGATNVVWTAMQYAPLFLIAKLQGGTQLAWFAGAARVVGSLLVFSSVYHFNLYPAVARAVARQDGELAPLLAASSRVTAWAGCFAALGLMLLAEPLLVIAMGARMAPAAPMLEVMAWMIPLTIASGHARWTMMAAGMQMRVLGALLAGLAATLAAGVVLGPAFGGLGYAFAAIAGFATMWLVAHFQAARLGLHPPPLVLVLKPLAVACVVFVAARALDSTPWLAFAWLAVYLAAAPLIDRRLLRDFPRLGRGTMAGGR